MYGGMSLKVSRVQMHGLIQGSPLSPALFLVAVADMPTIKDDNKEMVRLYADDVVAITKRAEIEQMVDSGESVAGFMGYRPTRPQ